MIVSLWFEINTFLYSYLFLSFFLTMLSIYEITAMIWIYRAKSDNPSIEHQLIFSPNSTTFFNLMNDVSNRLKLKPPIGVLDRSQFENIKQEDFIAAIEFHHSFVSSI